MLLRNRTFNLEIKYFHIFFGFQSNIKSKNLITILLLIVTDVVATKILYLLIFTFPWIFLSFLYSFSPLIEIYIHIYHRIHVICKNIVAAYIYYFIEEKNKTINASKMNWKLIYRQNIFIRLIQQICFNK